MKTAEVIVVIVATILVGTMFGLALVDFRTRFPPQDDVVVLEIVFEGNNYDCVVDRRVPGRHVLSGCVLKNSSAGLKNTSAV